MATNVHAVCGWRAVRRAALLALAFGLLLGCGSPKPDGKDSPKPNGKDAAGGKGAQPGTEEGARALLQEFVKPGADHAALSKQLRPTKEDYAAVFKADFAKKAESTYGPAWDAGQVVVAPKAGQTEVRLGSATTDELKKGQGKAGEFPGGYKQVAGQFKDGLTVYYFKFVKPGETTGMAYDGLIHVNGNWRIFPKPFRIK